VKLTLLLIEDDVDIQESLKDLLEDEGFRVLTADHGKDATAVLESLDAPPDVIILDLMMPVMDGREFRAWQLAHERFDEIPTFILSAAVNGAEEAKRLMASGFLQKPPDLDAILGLIEPYRGAKAGRAP
jgi:CheY-like chemotaxis protein